MMTVTEHLEMCAAVVASPRARSVVESKEGVLRQQGWTDVDIRGWRTELAFSSAWVSSGRIVYQLGHSIAAALAVTRAPAIEFERLPHRAFMISLPWEFIRTDHTRPTPAPTSWIMVMDGSALKSTSHRFVGVMHDADTSSYWMATDGVQVSEESPGAFPAPTGAEQNHFALRMACRLTANVVAYVTEHRQSIVADGKPGKTMTHHVKPPRDLVITKDFRDEIARMVAARDVGAARKALAHVVRGHWRNQACGPDFSERKLTWIKPHRRGDAELGSVVSRMERAVGPHR